MVSRFVFFAFFLWVSVVNAQETLSVYYDREPIADVLSDVEDKFRVKFSYSSELIHNQTISFKKAAATLETILFEITQQVDLEFHKITERYYLIKARSEPEFYTTQQLDEVVITEYLTSGISRKADGAISISPQKLGILPGLTEADVLETLQLIPGVQNPTETASGLFIRGGTPDQNLILWDGIKMYHSGHFFGMISAFNPYITSNVRLSTIGANARYGNRISSIIAIESVDKIPGNTQGGFGFNMTHADAFIKTPVTDNFALIASVRRSYTDAINTFTFENLSDRVFQNTKITEGNKIFDDDDFIITNDYFRFSDITLKAIFKPSDNDKIVVSSLATKNALDYSFLIEEFEETSNDKLEIENKGISASWNHSYGKSLSHQVQAYYSEFNLDYRGTNEFPDDLFDLTDKENTIQDKGVSVQTNWNINTNQTLSVGYQLSETRVDYILGFDSNFIADSNFLETDNSTNTTNAFYFDYEHKKNEKWQLNAGLRGDYVSVLKTFYLEPRISTQIYLNSDFKTRIAFEKRHQNVSQILEFNTLDFGLENQIWALAQDDFLPLQRSSTWSFGINFTKNGWNIDADLYLRKTKGLSSLARGFENSDSNYSEGESDISGLDVLIKKKSGNYRTWLSYTTAKKDFKFDAINDGQTFPGNFHIAHQLYWMHSYKLNRFDLSLGWRFRTGIPYTEALGFENDDTTIIYDKINNARLPNYHRLDFSTTYTFNFSKKETWKGKLGLSILNLYNRENVLSRVYKVRVSSDPNTPSFLQETARASLGITPNLVFRVEF